MKRTAEKTLRRVLTGAALEPRRLRSVASNLADAIVAFDADRRIILANGAAERYFGYEHGEIEGAAVDVLVSARSFRTLRKRSNSVPE